MHLDCLAPERPRGDDPPPPPMPPNLDVKTAPVKLFQENAYNFCALSLSKMPEIEGERPKERGVRAHEDIPKRKIVCLFPGEEVQRCPVATSFPLSISEVAKRKQADEFERDLPISDYCIRVEVTDFDSEGCPRASHYRFIDPMSDECSASACAPILSLPDQWRETARERAEELYNELRNRTSLPERSSRKHSFCAPTDPSALTAPFSAPSVAAHPAPFFAIKGKGKSVFIYCAGAHHFVCAWHERHEMKHAVQNLVLALNHEFDERRYHCRNAKKLKLDSAYPHAAPFINEPYAFENANVEFLAPSQWIPGAENGKLSATPSLRNKIASICAENLDYWQRPAVVATRNIRKGEELCVKYRRTAE